MQRNLFSSVCLILVIASLAAGCGDAGRDEADLTLNREEMRAELSEALQIRDTVEHFARIAELAGRLTKENAEGAADVFGPEIAWIPEYDLLPFVHAWVRVDDETALQRILQWAMASKRAFGVTEALYYLALNGETVRARAHAESITTPRLAEAAMIGLARGWARSGDLEGLARYLGAMEPGNVRDQMVRIANGTILLDSGLDRLREWIDGMPTEGRNGLRARAFRTALGQTAFKDPHYAASWLADFAGEPFASNMVVAVAVPWMEKDPAGLLDWLQSMPFDEDVATAARRVATRWIRLDPPGFEAWLVRAEPDPIRDAMIEAYTTHLLRKTPEQAASWSLRISSPDSRDRALGRVFEAWAQRDREAAAAWLEVANLPDSLHQTLAPRLERPPRARRGDAS